MAGILFESQKKVRELEKRVAVLESETIPMEQEAFVLTASGVNRMLISMIPTEKKLMLGMRGLFHD